MTRNLGAHYYWSLLLAWCVLGPSACARRPRRTAAETLDTRQATYDTSMLGAEAQVAISTAAFLSIVREEVTPAMLVEMLHLSLMQNPNIYGACIAFEPDSYPWHNDTVDPDHPLLRSGVDSANGSALWFNQSEPWTLPRTQLWPGKEAVLYAPYVARGPTNPQKQDPPYEIVMDLGDGYNYFDPHTEWYQKARSLFLQGELTFLQGMWGQPYLDEGAGGINMTTFSVPFTRLTPVPNMGPPPNDTFLFGWPENRPLNTDHGVRYFWGIATVDIDLSMLNFSCDAGKEYSIVDNDCVDCAPWRGFSNVYGRCDLCREFEITNEYRTGCTLNLMYAACAIAFHLMLLLMVIPATVRLRRPLYILNAEGREEGQRLILHLCNKHFLSKSSMFKSRSLDMPLVNIFGTGWSALDKPDATLRFKVVGESQIEVLRADSSPMQVEPEAIKGGYARIGLRYELLHITMILRVPLVAWLIAQFLAAVATAIVWTYNGATILTRLMNTATGTAVYLAISSAIRLTWRVNARRKQQLRAATLREGEIKAQLQAACWEADPLKEKEARSALMRVGWKETEINELTQQTLKSQSHDAGVSVAFLLSDVWTQLARNRCGAENPTFYELKDAFFFGAAPIGKDVPCPRDGRLGCSLVDTLPRPHRRACTHFLSWTWKYAISEVGSALENWMHESRLDPARTFLYMCFFVNNQYRILYECDGAGSTNLEEVFEGTLKRVGRVVAVLDHWEAPTYLTRIWTIFEQFTAIKLNIPVTMILPKDQNESLIEKVQEGRQGIIQVTRSMCRFKSENAKAYSPQDESKVKELIIKDMGFEVVDLRVKEFMLNWVGSVVHEYMKNLMDLDVAMARVTSTASGPSTSPVSEETMAYY